MCNSIYFSDCKGNCMISRAINWYDDHSELVNFNVCILVKFLKVKRWDQYISTGSIGYVNILVIKYVHVACAFVLESKLKTMTLCYVLMSYLY